MSVIYESDSYERPDNLLFVKSGQTNIQSPLLFSEANRFTDKSFGGLSSTNGNDKGKEPTKKARNLQEVDKGPVTIDAAKTAFITPGSTFKALPYLPYFSNCDYYGSMIYFPSIFEIHPGCTFYSPEDTIPIRVTSFGQSATADTCENVNLECRYSEDISAIGSKNYWFQAKSGSTLFRFYQEPITASSLKSFLNGDISISDENFIPVEVKSLSEEGKIPTTVSLTLEYYQLDIHTKKLINSEVSFSGFIDPGNVTSSNVYNYTLVLNWRPMTYTQLAIEFALPWYVYLTLYIVVCTMTVLMTLIFMIYHRVTSRYKISFSFLAYLKVYLPPSLLGLFYVVVPQLLYILIIAMVFYHHIMYQKLDFYVLGTSDFSSSSVIIPTKPASPPQSGTCFTLQRTRL